MCRNLTGAHIVWGFWIVQKIYVSASLTLTTYPQRATNGEPFTLMCTSSGSIAEDTSWFINGQQVFYIHLCEIKKTNPDKYTKLRLHDRSSVTCNPHQHNVTISAAAHLDEGVKWKCQYNVRGQNSQEIAIDVTPTKNQRLFISYVSTVKANTGGLTKSTEFRFVSSDIGTTKYKSATESSTSSNATTRGSTKSPISGFVSPDIRTTKYMSKSGSADNSSNSIIYIVAGSVGGAAVVVVIVIVMVCYRRKRQCHTARDKSELASTGVSDSNIEEDELVMANNVLYCSSSDIHPQKGQGVLDSGILTRIESQKCDTLTGIEDMCKKPVRLSEQCGVTNVYAQVNKVKSVTNHGKRDVVNIEDLYAKPIKKGSTNQS